METAGAWRGLQALPTTGTAVCDLCCALRGTMCPGLAVHLPLSSRDLAGPSSLLSGDMSTGSSLDQWAALQGQGRALRGVTPTRHHMVSTAGPVLSWT